MKAKICVVLVVALSFVLMSCSLLQNVNPELTARLQSIEQEAEAWREAKTEAIQLYQEKKATVERMQEQLKQANADGLDASEISAALNTATDELAIATRELSELKAFDLSQEKVAELRKLAQEGGGVADWVLVLLPLLGLLGGGGAAALKFLPIVNAARGALGKLVRTNESVLPEEQLEAVKTKNSAKMTERQKEEVRRVPRAA